MSESKIARIVIPFINEQGVLFGFAGRAVSSKVQNRYITIMLDESMPKIFGLDRVDFNKKYYLVEGPIDSLFLTNAIAMAGTSADTSALKNKENLVYVFDNEPRNKEVVKFIESRINNGYSVCIWPDHIVEKDINDMIISGLTPADIKLIIDQNTFSGLTASLRLSYWRKC